MAPPVLAAISPDAVVYLIVLVIWGFAQLARLSRKKGGAAPTPNGEPASPVPPELRDLLETLTGRPVVAEPLPPVTRRIVRSTPAAPQTRTMRTPMIQTTLEPQPAAAKPEAYKLPIVESPRAEFAAPAQFIRQTFASTPTLHLPSVKLASNAAGHLNPSPLLRGLRHHDELRAAFVQRAVLGPPRAFDPA